MKLDLENQNMRTLRPEPHNLHACVHLNDGFMEQDSSQKGGLMTSKKLPTIDWPPFDPAARGTGSDYEPYEKIYHTHKSGFHTRRPSLDNERLIHCQNDLVLGAVLMAEEEPDTTDIYEDWPLQLSVEQAAQISDALHVQCPLDSKTHKPVVLSTAIIVVRSSDGIQHLEARLVGEISKLKNSRIHATHTILKAYWDAMGVPCTVVTNADVNHAYLQNAQYFAACRKQLARKVITTAQCQTMAELLLDAIVSSPETPLNVLERSVEAATGCDTGSGIYALVSLADSYRISIQMKRPFSTIFPCNVVLKNIPTIQQKEAV
jgi:hypothetical protein